VPALPSGVADHHGRIDARHDCTVAGAIDAQQRQAQCELAAIGSTRSRLAIDWIRTACNRLAIDVGPLNERNRLFYRCLLSYLSGVQNDAAASRIISACRTSYPP
jgi:hypothetical protein